MVYTPCKLGCINHISEFCGIDTQEDGHPKGERKLAEGRHFASIDNKAQFFNYDRPQNVFTSLVYLFLKIVGNSMSRGKLGISKRMANYFPMVW